MDETYDKTGPLFLPQTTAVGLYPQGASPEGLLDGAGNVWEWCLNKYRDLDDIHTQGDDLRSLRGGSWNYVAASARAVSRFRNSPDNRLNATGLRVVYACPITDH